MRYKLAPAASIDTRVCVCGGGGGGGVGEASNAIYMSPLMSCYESNFLKFAY